MERLTESRLWPRHVARASRAAHRRADDLEEKRKLAHDEIDCSGSLDYTRKQVQILVDRLKRMAGSRAN